MFKKLLTLCAVAAMAYTAKAETVEAYYHDFSGDASWNGYVMGYIPEIVDGELVAKAPMVEYVEVYERDGNGAVTDKINEENAKKYGNCEHISINGDDSYIVPLEEPAGWYQFFLSNGQVPGKKGMMHLITVTCYAPELEDGEVVNATLQCRWSWSENPINVELPITNKKEAINVVCNGPAGDNFDVIFQLGNYTGEIHFNSLKVVYENIKIEKEYVDLLTNGDASQAWENPDWQIQTIDSDNGIYDAPDGWMNICVWGKENMGNPHPAKIEAVDGNPAFVVHATAKAEQPWDNQLWICAPRAFNDGESFNVTFRLKATKEAAPETQAHVEPSHYIHWSCIGKPNFGTNWSEYSKDVTVAGAMSGMYSIAFNLNDFADANDYYIDDVKWQLPVIREGWFIASDAIANGILDAAEEMKDGTYLDVYEAKIATVGSAVTPASYVQISTMKGDDGAFKSNCIGVGADVIDGEPMDYNEKSENAKILFPEPGVWNVYLLPEANIVVFEQGEAGINSVKAEIVAPEYYNLQGVRVDNPTHGIYIIKRGNKVTKQVIR